tara:strand:- start:298 stop:576 length:279 start_codon:yes stop_codon:yes gene_type:complete
MKFYFYPTTESTFKKEASGHYVRTIIFNVLTGEIEQSFVRKVSSVWQQTCKNNIATDQRVKALNKKNHEIYSWVVTAEKSFSLPSFTEFGQL